MRRSQTCDNRVDSGQALNDPQDVRLAMKVLAQHGCSARAEMNIPHRADESRRAKSPRAREHDLRGNDT